MEINVSFELNVVQISYRKKARGRVGKNMLFVYPFYEKYFQNY